MRCLKQRGKRLKEEGCLEHTRTEAKQVEAKLKRDELEWKKQYQSEKFKEQMVVEETKRQIQRDQEETKRQMALQLIEAGKDPEQTKAFLNALGYM